MERKRLKKFISLIILVTILTAIFIGCGKSKKELKKDDQVLTYTFKLRKDAKWSNGDTVTAQDYEYAWKRVLNPETSAEYAYQMYYIKGAEAYNTGKGNVDDVGIKVIDDYTLEVQLQAPTSYFLELTAFPVNKKIVKKDKGWATKVDTYVSNGPFKLIEWNLKDSLVFEKNDAYYNKDEVKLDKLIMKMVTDETSAFATFKAGDFDMIDVVPTSEIEAGLKDGTFITYPNLGTYFLVVNVNGENNSDDVKKALGDKEVRKALSLAIDRDSIVKNITKGGEIPSYSFVPKGIPGADGKAFADPMTFLDLLTSTSALNNSGFSNSEYDSIIKEAKQETNVVKREELLHKAEDILMEDMSVIPLYYYTQVKGIKPYVKGIRVTQLGFIYFDKAYIDGK